MATETRERDSNLVYFMDFFKEFCVDNDYDWNNVELLGILQYFNICTLYDNFKDGRYGNFLFLYGKYLLAKFLYAKPLIGFPLNIDLRSSSDNL